MDNNMAWEKQELCKELWHIVNYEINDKKYIFEDDKVYIECNSSFSLCCCYVKIDKVVQELVIKMSSKAGFSKMEEFHPGKWEQYIHKLYIGILERKQKEKARFLIPASKKADNVFK